MLTTIEGLIQLIDRVDLKATGDTQQVRTPPGCSEKAFRRYCEPLAVWGTDQCRKHLAGARAPKFDRPIPAVGKHTGSVRRKRGCLDKVRVAHEGAEQISVSYIPQLYLTVKIIRGKDHRPVM